ncbi:MAG TPA: TusE/DsrC/DsvC family sulfur relay protein [Gammaproteobacteria bacterium]|nr:TusE/DsrC/DsvC family sulfur relay protein [Gammaproteobacteria bacterium]
MDVEFNPAGFLKNPDDWNEDVMRYIAEREGIELTDEIIDYVKSARAYYQENAVVPPLREFSKMHGGDRKGTHLNKLFHGGPMKKIAMLGGLPQPTGCV